MRRLLLILALQTSAACATLHVPPPSTAELAPEPIETDENEDAKPVLLASASGLASMSDAYAGLLLGQAIDLNQGKFRNISLTGNLTLVQGKKVCLNATCTMWITYDGTSMNFALSNASYLSINNATGAISGLQGAFTGSVGSGNNAFAVATNGARVDFGAGASDYASSDGTTVTFAGAVTFAGTLISQLGGVRLSDANTNAGVFSGTAAGFTTNSGVLRGDVTNSAGNSASTVTNVTALTSGVDRYIQQFHNGSAVTSRVFTDGTYQNLATVGTAASGTGVTANYVGAQRGWTTKTTVINTAMTAAATTDITIATTPVNSRIIRVTADVTQVFTGGALSAVTVQCGNVAGGTQYLLANSVFAAVNTWGDVQAEVGAGLLTATWADFGTSAAGVPGAITVSCRFSCTGANCSAATQGSVSFYVEGVTY